MRIRSIFQLLSCLLVFFCVSSAEAQTTSPFDDGNTQIPKLGTTNSGNVALAPVAPEEKIGQAAATYWMRSDMGSKTGQVFCVTQDKVNIRKGPGTDFAIVRATTFGNLFPVIGEQGGWYQIALSGLDSVLPKSSPEEIEESQRQFLASYKTYTQYALTVGKADPKSKTALAKFRGDYAAYKISVRNSVSLQNIRAGTLKVDKVVVSKANFTATVYADNKIVRVYPLAYGSNMDALSKKAKGDCRTPEGNFKITGKAKNPEYHVPETGQVIPGGVPNNPFGTRFMGLNTWGGSIGMHGTSNPSSIGTRASHGCMRMFTPDAEELFDLVRVGTPVTILPVSAG
ncbi:MAG: L,D-transpeptidase family protein [Candidatus Ozemobacteraceae bacterium]